MPSPEIFHRRSIRATVVAGLLALIGAMGLGCASAPSVASSLMRSVASTQPVYVVHLPGIGGPARIDDWMLNGLKSGGIDLTYIIINWTGNDRGIAALVRYDKNRELARKLSKRLVDIIGTHPNDRIVMTGHSAGNGLLVWALEDLPEGVQIDTAILLSAALSPGYDLSKALRHVRRMYSFSSQNDDFVLGTGTEIFGTMDGVKTESAGMVGFKIPAQAGLYSKLTQIPYDPAWQKWGNFGGHIDDMREEFAREVLAPLLVTGHLPTTRESHDP